MIAQLVAATLGVAAAGQTAPVASIPFTVGDNAIIVDALVNGKKVSCMFDTGFSGSFVLSDSFNIGKPTGVMSLRDFVGEFQAKTVAIKTLQIGSANIKTPNLEVVQQPMSHLSASYNTHTDGIMGIEVFKDFATEINFEKKLIFLHPKGSNPIAKKKGDGKKSFVIPMLPVGHNSVELPVTTPSGEQMILALDTGNAFYATTHKDVLERVGVWKAGEKPNFMGTAFVASGPVATFYMYMKDMSIWGVPVAGSVWSIIDLPSSDANHDGTIGFGFLKNFNIIIDKQARKVYLENWTGKVADAPEASIGMAAAFDDRSKRYLIYSVTPGGPAAKAGIQRGDALLSIDGHELLDAGARKLEEWINGPLGSIAKVAISKQGSLVRHELKREYLINGMPANK